MPDRRYLLQTLAAAAFVAVLPRSGQAAPERIALWPDAPPGGGGPRGEERRNPSGAVRNVAVPRLDVYRPAMPNGTAVLIAAGGGYTRIQIGKEAEPAARWLAGQGIAAFVLHYRLPGEGWHAGPRAPLQDIQRALRLIRGGMAGESFRHVGLLGFSAGGHLAGLAATRAAFRSYAPVDAADALSARADFAALIYPIVTLQKPYDHTATRRQLVGRHPSDKASAGWSVETHVRSRCPPLFLAQAADDPVSDPANTAILDAAAHRAGVPVERHLFASGGHGFGLGRPGTPSMAWPGLCRTWLAGLGML